MKNLGSIYLFTCWETSSCTRRWASNTRYFSYYQWGVHGGYKGSGKVVSLVRRVHKIRDDHLFEIYGWSYSLQMARGSSSSSASGHHEVHVYGARVCSRSGLLWSVLFPQCYWRCSRHSILYAVEALLLMVRFGRPWNSELLLSLYSAKKELDRAYG